MSSRKLTSVYKLKQALRRSIKGEKESKPHVTIAPKSAVAIVPPKKVIRALYDYQAQSAQELSFSRGDFFHVIGRENDQDWYEACNPALPDARGLVPVAFFQALGRTERDSGQSNPDLTRTQSTKNPDHDSGYADTSGNSANSPPPQPQSSRSSKTQSRSGAMVYGIVMYDFKAERADELEAKAGEAIIVIAQSNPEWFVAKPIGRLGGPGLIPVSFVEIRDMATNIPVPNPQDAVKRAGIPKVEEWKKMAADYKNSSITLGKFEGGAAPQSSIEQGMSRMSLQQQQQQPQQGPPQPQTNGANYQPQQPAAYGAPQQNPQQQQAQPYQFSSKTPSQLFAPISARIPRYCFAEEKYWFVIEAQLEDGSNWELSRYYEDFYDFQIALLTEFPAEAGNTGTQKRTLPYMPGPVNYVTDAITEGRLHNLDAYVKNLLAQPDYISKCNLVKQFFAPREGDYEVDMVEGGMQQDGGGPNGGNNDYRLSNGSQISSSDSPRDGTSRQSSKQNLNGGNGNYAMPRQQQQPGGPSGAMARQASSLSQPSQSSLSPGIQQAGAAIKVKLSYNGDLIAIRVPSDIDFRDLYQRIAERLKIPPGEEVALSYRDDKSGNKVPMLSDNDLDFALQHNEKLLVYVE
ncbi:MAP kinase activator [Coniochaeta sp. 2T2.1]|nr:MAP kinase activator [Coniochaeta sp. 2T2.1]